MIFVNSIKDIFEDLNRKEFDNTENNRQVLVYDKEKLCFDKKMAKNIELGDIVKVKRIIIVGSTRSVFCIRFNFNFIKKFRK